MKSICGADCANCEMNKACKGCVESNGCPLGVQCFIAKYIQTGGTANYEQFKQQLISEFNGLGLPGTPKITELYALSGAFVNLAYPMPSGDTVKLLDDKAIYLGNQLEIGNGRCYGLVASPQFLLVCEYGENGADPEIVIFMRR